MPPYIYAQPGKKGLWHMNRDPEKEMENAQELEQAMKEAMCEGCRFAIWDYNESGSWVDD